MILLSFDTEEFDVPLEHQVDISFDHQMEVSIAGTNKILDCLERHQTKATFFCTVTFAIHAPEVMKRILAGGHEVASHGYYHSNFKEEHLRESKLKLEELTHTSVCGYRQARMMPVSEKAIADAGYTYNSSLNPTFIPGRYMNLSTPRTCFLKEGVLQIPVSVTPWFRFPLFWLSCHNLPTNLYRWLCHRTLKHDGYFAIYFHPWEFYPLAEHPEWKIPFVIKNNSGREMEKRLNDFIVYFKKRGVPFATYSDLTALKQGVLSNTRL